MRAVCEIARLTLWESFKRRTATVAILLSLVLIVGMALLALRTEHKIQQRREARGQPAVFMVDGKPAEHALFTELVRKGGLWIVRTFTMFLAILLAAGALAGERDSGVLIALTSKPVARWQLFLGKWLGLNGILLLYLVLLGTALLAVLAFRTGEFTIEVLYGALASLLFGVLFTTLTLAFSSVASAWLSAALGLLCWFVGSQEYGLVRMIAHGLNGNEHTQEAANVLFAVCQYCGLFVPSGRIALWVDKISGRLDLPGMMMGPAPFVRPEASPWDLAYLAVYLTGLLLVSGWVFARADL